MTVYYTVCYLLISLDGGEGLRLIKTGETHLPTDDRCLGDGPVVVTYCTPLIVIVKLHPTFGLHRA